MTFDEIKNSVANKFPDAILGIDENATPKALIIAKEQLLEVSTYLYQDENMYFDMLSCLTGIDNGVESNTMEVVYNLYSIPFEHALMLKVELIREKPVIHSVSDIWKTANWHEREAYDLLGITFEGHPDLRRILLPADWEGHPLKKDYEHQEKYRGIKVAYE